MAPEECASWRKAHVQKHFVVVPLHFFAPYVRFGECTVQIGHFVVWCFSTHGAPRAQSFAKGRSTCPMDVFRGGARAAPQSMKLLLRLSSLYSFLPKPHFTICVYRTASMLIMMSMHVFDKLYASRDNLNIQRLIIHNTTFRATGNVLTRNIKYMRHCTLPSML